MKQQGASTVPIPALKLITSLYTPFSFFNTGFSSATWSHSDAKNWQQEVQKCKEGIYNFSLGSISSQVITFSSLCLIFYCLCFTVQISYISVPLGCCTITKAPPSQDMLLFTFLTPYIISVTSGAGKSLKQC